MKRSLAFSAALLLVTAVAVAQNKQAPYRSKPQHSTAPKSKSVKAAPPHHASTSAPVTAGKTSSVNQQLSQLEHETSKTVNSPHKTSASAPPAMKSNNGASTKRAMTFSYQQPKTAAGSARATQSQNSSRTGVRGRVVGTGK